MALTRTKTIFGLAVILAMIAVVGIFGWRMYTAGHSVCQVCQRPLHSHSRTVAVVDGDTPETFCCPTCAVTAARQTGERLDLRELIDYISREPLDPRDAFLVRGSDVNPCLEAHSLMHSDKQAAHIGFDRCSPSILAFGDRSTAEDFVRTHGGSVIRVENLEAE